MNKFQLCIVYWIKKRVNVTYQRWKMSKRALSPTGNFGFGGIPRSPEINAPPLHLCLESPPLQHFCPFRLVDFSGTIFVVSGIYDASTCYGQLALNRNIKHNGVRGQQKCCWCACQPPCHLFWPTFQERKDGECHLWLKIMGQTLDLYNGLSVRLRMGHTLEFSEIMGQTLWSLSENGTYYWTKTMSQTLYNIIISEHCIQLQYSSKVPKNKKLN